MQQTFTDMEYANRKRTTRREAFLKAMESIIPWNEWMKLIAPFYVQKGHGKERDSTGNHAADAPHAELVRSFWRGHRGGHLRQLRHETLSEDCLFHRTDTRCHDTPALPSFARKARHRRKIFGCETVAGCSRTHHARIRKDDHLVYGDSAISAWKSARKSERAPLFQTWTIALPKGPSQNRMTKAYKGTKGKGRPSMRKPQFAAKWSIRFQS